jgi:SulP family sulfate permease
LNERRASLPEWAPKLLHSLRGYTGKTFAHDLVAGLTVGLVALPLAMAFAISSGVKPEAGIYCAIVAGFLVSLLGGSRTQIAGPTGAFVVIVYGIVQEHGVAGLYVATLMAGLILIVLGATGLGSAVDYIPRPVVVGFTNGIAVLIASTQIKDFFGLEIAKVPGEFVPRLVAIGDHWGTLNIAATSLSAVCLLVLIAFRVWANKVPASIIVLVVATVVAALFKLPIETIETTFGGIPQGLPAVQVPVFDMAQAGRLAGPAFTIAILGAIESLMSAVVADRMSKDKHQPNTELVAQGVANVFSPLVGGIPVTGAIARTATNIRSGAKTPVAGLIHALVLVVVLLVGAPLAGHIPLAVLSAILMMVAYNMGEWAEIPWILRLTKADVSVWLVTFALTVFADLTVAVTAGLVLAALLYIKRVTDTTTVAEATEQYIKEGEEHILQFKDIPEGVKIFRVHGPFLFGATDKLEVIEEQISSLPPVVVLRLRNMTAIDGTGLHAIEDLAMKLSENGRTLILCGMRGQPERLMRRAEFEQIVGKENMCPSVGTALQRANDVLATPPVPSPS